jgi:methylmalonyl-CoA carboxyltransferase large subunit
VSTAVDDPPASQHDLDELLRRVEQLEAELAELRAALGSLPAVPEHVVLAISAAVAAFLGERATVRQIHLAGDTAWAREGRSYVQSTHSAARRR